MEKLGDISIFAAEPGMLPTNKAFDVAENVVDFVCANGAGCDGFSHSSSDDDDDDDSKWMIIKIALVVILLLTVVAAVVYYC